jgi:hypothetical protein
MTGAQFEISLDGVPRTYRDRKDLALLAATRKGKQRIWGQGDTPTFQAAVCGLTLGETREALSHWTLSATFVSSSAGKVVLLRGHAAFCRPSPDAPVDDLGMPALDKDGEFTNQPSRAELAEGLQLGEANLLDH